jgi:hypothetical protein
MVEVLKNKLGNASSIHWFLKHVYLKKIYRN